MTERTAAPPTFADTLRKFRRAAGLTQDALAERAGLSTRAVSDLERGVKRRPQRETVRLLTDALALSADDRAHLEAAAFGHAAPARRSLAPPPHNLPAPVTSFVGRTREVAAAVTLLRRDAVRLVTVIGPGGVGKTRLAIETATAVLNDYMDGVAFVPLATVRDPERVTATIALSLGMSETGGRSLMERLIATLRTKRLLLVLDNFEHLLSEAIVVANLLAHCPGLTVLATSRAPLSLQGEHLLPLPPLPLPDSSRGMDPAALSQSPAIRLFAQRARAVEPGFRLTAVNAPAVVAICARLDGLPLALELAAARIRFLTPDALLARLTRRLPELTGDARDQPARQRTMRDAIAWSYDLLTAAEQRLFRHLAVFVGGCTLDAVVAVLEGDATVVEIGLHSLVDKSLVRHEKDEAPARITMLETIREYGADRLAARGELSAARERHAAYYTTLALAAERDVRGPRQTAWLRRFESEHDNFRAALTWAHECDDVSVGISLAAALWRFWNIHGDFGEGRGWLEHFLTRGNARGGVTSAITANALLGAGLLAYRQNDNRRAQIHLEESLARYRAMDEAIGVTDVLIVLGNVAYFHGDYAHAAPLHAEALEVCRTLDYRWGVATALNNHGLVAEAQGRYAGAARYHEESLDIRREIDDAAGIAMSLTNLGQVARSRGDWRAAVALQEESLAMSRTQGNRWGIATALNHLGIALQDSGDVEHVAAHYAEARIVSREIGDQRNSALALRGLGDVARAQGDHEEAAARFTESLTRCRAIGYRRGGVECMERLARVAQGRGESAQAVHLLAAAAVVREEMSAPVPLADRPAYDALMEAARSALGAEGFATAWGAGSAGAQDTGAGTIAEPKPDDGMDAVAASLLPHP